MLNWLSCACDTCDYTAKAKVLTLHVTSDGIEKYMEFSCKLMATLKGHNPTCQSSKAN